MEIFSSVQGEGPYAGVRQVFVRFFECNMHCAWCDTPASIGDGSRNFKTMGAEEVLNDIARRWDTCHSVSLTGGEPLLQTDFIKILLPSLNRAGRPVYLETNGIFPKELSEIVGRVDIVSMDMKLPSSTKCRPYWEEHAQFLRVAVGSGKEVFIKAVVTADTQREDVLHAARLTAEIAPETLFILQPNTYELAGAVARCVEFQKDCMKILPRVRVMPQTHKFMKIP